MSRHLLRRIIDRHAIAREKRVAALTVEMNVRLEARRAARAENSERSRKGASTRAHHAFVSDVVRNEMVGL